MKCDRATVVVFLLLSEWCGCASKSPPPLQPPQAKLGRVMFSGSSLSGPTTRPVNLTDRQQALLVSVRLLAVERFPDAMLKQIGVDARLIADSRGGNPVLSTNRLTRGLKWATADEAASFEQSLSSLGQSAEMSSDRFALPRGASVTVRAMQDEADPRGILLTLHQLPTAAQLEISVEVDDRVQADRLPEASEAPASAEPSTLQSRELAILKPLDITAATPVAIAIPFQFEKSPARCVVALIQAAPGADDDETTKLLAAAGDAIKQSSGAISRSATAPAEGAPWAGYEWAMSGLTQDASRRSSLAYLCSQTRAAICGDAALVAADPALSDIAARIAERAADPKLAHDDLTLSWMLDASALDVIAKLQTANQLPPELLSVLVRHTGQVGMNSGSVGEMLAAAKGRADFDARVQAENIIYLEDGSPAARVRACDWLAARGKAPAGYDPLAPPRRRQAALEKMYEAMAAKSSGQTGGQP